MNPDLAWLQSRWELPDDAAGEISRYLAAEAEGSTAVEILQEPSGWGRAAAAPGAGSPLVLVEHAGRRFLQSRQLFRAEASIARRLRALAAIAFPPPPEDRLARLFPGAGADDRQLRAARTAASRALTLITGGPGTGKTHTLARILALLAAEGVAVDRIRLAAPTGKAADRMKKAVSESLGALDGAAEIARVADSSSTLHALLGYNPSSGACRFDAGHPLPCSVLIVDECSMVDALLWRALLEALPPDVRLILLGDPNQLESVGQGNVFAELARLSATAPLAECHVHLTEARRFRDRPAILALAGALERSDASAAEEVLAGDGAGGVVWIPHEDGPLPLSAFPGAIREALEAVATAPTPGDALARLGAVCVLTAQREHFVGARAMSAAIQAEMAERPDTRNHPVIINRNDPETGLRNGSVGVFHREADGRRQAYFPAVNGELRPFSAASLPDHSPAWAITIHRSQGSEYDEVLVLLPQETSPLATRELLYTAITRARRTVFIAGSPAAIRKAAASPSARRTLLGAHF